MNNDYDLVIIGAGLAGLSAAIELERFDLKVLVIDESDRVGGRIKTDEVDGFLLDRGFQVYLDSYPEGKQRLNYDELQLKAFDTGAFCFNGAQSFLVSDTNRNKLALPRMAFSPVGSFMDKIRMGNLVAHVKKSSVEEIFARPETSTMAYLKERRLSSKIIERFFQPFFSGIFLEPALATSSRMFEFVFKMMSEGSACVPEGGMEMIPKQLKAQLSSTEFRFHTKVKEIKGQEIIIEGHDSIRSAQIIVACAPDKLLPQLAGPTQWQSTANYYFSAHRSPLKNKTVALNFASGGLVNNLAVMSDVAKSYAPEGKHLISVSLRHTPDDSVEDVSEAIKKELRVSFGDEVANWQFIRNYHIKHALPQVKGMKASVNIGETKIREGLYLAGDQMLNASINAAMKSGELAAKQAVLEYKSITS